MVGVQARSTLKLAVLPRKQVNNSKEGALGKGDKSINKPIFIISLMIVLKLLDGKGRHGVTQVLINRLRGTEERGAFGEMAGKVDEMRPPMSEDLTLQCPERRSVWSFRHLVWSLCLPAFDPLRHLILSRTIRLGCVFVGFFFSRINVALIGFLVFYKLIPAH